jgi:hypothetical protein
MINSGQLTPPLFICQVKFLVTSAGVFIQRALLCRGSSPGKAGLAAETLTGGRNYVSGNNLELVAKISDFLSVGFSQARYPTGNRTWEKGVRGKRKKVSLFRV